MTLFGAHKADVLAIETVFPDIHNAEGLKGYVDRARRDGFTGMMALHPAQVAIINAGLTPSAAEIAHAQEIVALFDANPGLGVVQLHGKMIDAPHLKLAWRILAQAPTATQS